MNSTFLCPITKNPMIDPVIDHEGNSYEKEAIIEWLKIKNISPITRNPLYIEQLVPNRALQNNLSTDLELSSDSSDEPIEITELNIDVKSNLDDIMVTIKSKDASRRLPLDIVIVIDTSGSMNNKATVKNAEDTGLSILDIVKHATKTIIEVLSRKDRLSIVKYSNFATVILELTKMDKIGKTLATSRLNTLQPDGMTNLWDGIHKALDILHFRNTRKEANSAIFLLTDGEPNIEPPRGYIPTLKSYCDNHGGKYPGIINTFGFGYSLNSKLLESISNECNGTYAFIPDSGFVGTVFENALANTLTLRGTNSELCIETLDEITLTIPHRKESWGISINVGNIQYGQDRNFVFKVSTKDGIKPLLNIIFKYNNLETNNRGVINIENPFIEESSDNILYHTIRQKTVSLINNILNNQITELDNLIKEVKCGYMDDNIRELLKDLEGQIKESVLPKNFYKWGVHYLPSLRRAHELQQCNNFKDPGVQLYGGNLFKKIRDEADDIFLNKIPIPVPSLLRYTASNLANANTPIQMSTFSSRDNACFHGSSKVFLANGKFKFASEIVKGDLVKLGDPNKNGIGEIECVVKTNIKTSINLIKISDDLIITYWHPIKINDIWSFPCELNTAKDCTNIYCEAVYSFVIKKNRGNGRGIVIGNVECATLGHGILNTPVISHPFFGTEKVINILQKSNSYYDGFVILNEHSFIRDEKTNLICSILL